MPEATEKRRVKPKTANAGSNIELEEFLKQIAPEAEDRAKKYVFMAKQSAINKAFGDAELLWEAANWRRLHPEQFKRRYLPKFSIDDSERSAQKIRDTKLTDEKAAKYERYFRYSFADPAKPGDALVLLVGGNMQGIDPAKTSRNRMLGHYMRLKEQVANDGANVDLAYSMSGSVPLSKVSASKHPLVVYEHLKTMLQQHLIRGQKTLIIDAYSMGAGLVAKLFNEKDQQGRTTMEFLKDRGVERIFIVLRDPMSFPPTGLPVRALQEPPNADLFKGEIPIHVITMYQEDTSWTSIDVSGEVPFKSKPPFLRVFKFNDPEDKIGHLELDWKMETPYRALWDGSFDAAKSISEQFGLAAEEMVEVVENER